MSRDFPLGAVDGYSFGVYYVDGRGGVGTRTTHFTYHKIASSLSMEIQVSFDSGSYKKKSITEYQRLQHGIREREQIKYRRLKRD